MTALDNLLLMSAFTALFALLSGNRPTAGSNLTVLYGGQCLALALMAGLGYGGSASIASSLSFDILGHALHWRFDGLSWFFAVITVGAALLSSWVVICAQFTLFLLVGVCLFTLYRDNGWETPAVTDSVSPPTGKP